MSILEIFGRSEGLHLFRSIGIFSWINPGRRAEECRQSLKPSSVGMAIQKFPKIKKRKHIHIPYDLNGIL